MRWTVASSANSLKKLRRTPDNLSMGMIIKNFAKGFLLSLFVILAPTWAQAIEVNGYACDPGITCLGDYTGQYFRGQCVCAKSCGSRTNSCVDQNACLEVASRGQVCNTPDAVPEGPNCQQTYQQLVERCDEEFRAAEESCDSKNNSQMNSVSNTASQLSVALGSQSAASITAACSTMGTLAGAANAAVAAYRMMCSSAISSCKSACAEMASYVEQNRTCLSVVGYSGVPAESALKSKVERCDQFQNNVEEANQAITNLIGTAKNASQCSNSTAATVGDIPVICQTNPTMVGCASTTAKDCTDPTQAATNLVCICSVNPTSEKCIKGMNSSGGAGVGGGNTDFSSRLPDATTGGIGAGDLNDLPEIMHGKAASGRGGAAADGKMGGAPVGGGGGGADSGVPPLGGGGGAGSGEDKYGTSGFYGGGGRGGGFGTPGSARAGASGSGGAAGAGANANVNPDLRKFLPGGQFDPKRGMAGADGLDGITGPNTNIWMKIQNRYRVMSPTLLP